MCMCVKQGVQILSGEGSVQGQRGGGLIQLPPAPFSLSCPRPPLLPTLQIRHRSGRREPDTSRFQGSNLGRPQGPGVGAWAATAKS